MKLSLNQATVRRWTLAEAVAGCAAAGIEGIGLWRDQVTAIGSTPAGELVRDAGLTITSLCRGGFFSSDGAYSDNISAIDEAATVGADVLILVCGGLAPGDTDLRSARRNVIAAIEQLVPHAAARGIQLAVEALHPMFCADRSVVSTLGQALDIAECFDAEVVGVVIDAYHVWWDPALEDQIARAGALGRILSFQISDWVTPLPADTLLGRGHVGDGWIDLSHLARLVADTGYQGFVEVEIFNNAVWDAPGETTLELIVERARAVLPG